MKRIVCVALAVLCLGCLAACSETTTGTTKSSYEEEPDISPSQAQKLIGAALIEKLESNTPGILEEYELVDFTVETMDASEYGEYTVEGTYTLRCTWNDESRPKTYGFSGTVDKYTGSVMFETIYGAAN